jgi:hypothetical protein
MPKGVEYPKGAEHSHKTVDTSAICSWLGIPPDQWPPDHYALLGLEAGASDVEQIEQNVHQRLERVRHYQLTHPEAATEAMNRLAQAFVCLTDPQAKRAYDRLLLGEPPEPEPEPPAVPTSAAEAPPAVPPQKAPVAWPAAPTDTPVPASQQRTVLDVSLGDTAERLPPPPLVPTLAAVEEIEAPELIDLAAEEAPPAAVAAPAAAPPPAEPIDPVLETARSSEPARRGLGTKRALYYRVARTRSLLTAWSRAGKYFNDPKRKLSRPAEARELLDLLAAIRRLLENFPPLLGQAGQPGYLVVALARQQVIVPTFQTLLPSQREALARDWAAGQKLLLAHKDFLRQELRGLRRKTSLGRALRATRAFLNEHPAGLLVVLGLLAVAIALWREFL